MTKATRLHHLLDASALLHPGATALIYKDESISYLELSRRSGELRDILSSCHIRPGDRVALYLSKSIDYVCAIFATLGAGAAYLPLDASSPAARTMSILDDCEPALLICPQEHAARFETQYSFVQKLQNGLALCSRITPPLSSSTGELAYILYTSGSTGKPKGVMHSHSSALSFLEWCSSRFSPTVLDRFSSHAPFHFDLSILDLFLSVKHAAALVLIDEETARNPLFLSSLISEKKISIWYSTPTILNLLSVYGKMKKEAYPALRIVLFAGEVFPAGQFRNLKACWPGPEYYNLYGPTETNVCTYYKIPDETGDQPFPIGRCCDHYECRISASGELLVSGKGMMLGYWQNEILTADSLETDARQRKWYKTGDQVERSPQGELLFKGRKDRMIKRHGYRIELQEIENALARHPGIMENAVIATSDEQESILISAFISMRAGEKASVIGMKEFCLIYLPAYMIPTNFIFLDSLPKTASNKTDYQSLKQLI